MMRQTPVKPVTCDSLDNTRHLCTPSVFPSISTSMSYWISSVRGATFVLILTDAGPAVLVQAETPAAKALKGACAVLARVLAAAVHSQTLVDV